jgi:protein-S-isoprenylcysteine O-methyltransferase Ste14
MRYAVQIVAAVITCILLIGDMRAGLWGFVIVFGLETLYYTWTLIEKPKAVTRDLQAHAAAWAVTLYPLLSPVVAGRYDAPHWRIEAADVLTACGVLLEIAALATLRTAFTQLAEARRIVSTGLYRFVRHPLYVAYFITFGAEALLVMKPTFWAMYALFVWLEWLRARAEERILERTFGADYDAYRRRTGMFWPRFDGDAR